MNVRSRWILSLLAFLLVAPAYGQRHFYGFDNDLEGWYHLYGADQVTWEADLGVPPGSMKSTSAIAVSPCLPATPGGNWHIATTAFTENSGCSITAVGFDLPDCSDGASGSPDVFSETRIAGEWVELSFDYPLELFDPYFQIQASPLNGGDICYFDNVEAIGPLGPPSPVPTLDDTAMLLLAALIAAAGVLLVRRRAEGAVTEHPGERQGR